jgi:hypothetical protein
MLRKRSWFSGRAGCLEQSAHHQALDLAAALCAGRAPRDAVDPLAIGFLGHQIQTQFLADYAGKKPAHGVRLPSRHLRDVLDCDSGRLPQQVENVILFRIAVLTMSGGLTDGRL